jgi:putative redox protein
MAMWTDMQSDPSAHRSVRLERIESSRYLVTNDRGGQIRIGKGEGTDFTPVDLLLAGIGGCTAVDVDLVTSRRAEPEAFEVAVDADKVRDDAGNHLADIVVTFRIRFPGGDRGDKARALLPDVVRMSHDRLCTVSRTVELATPVATRIELSWAIRAIRTTRIAHESGRLSVPAEAAGDEAGGCGPEGQAGRRQGSERAYSTRHSPDTASAGLLAAQVRAEIPRRGPAHHPDARRPRYEPTAPDSAPSTIAVHGSDTDTAHGARQAAALQFVHGGFGDGSAQ